MSPAQIRDRMRLIKRNLAEGRAGGWAANGYSLEQIEQCQRDAAQRLAELTGELRVAMGRERWLPLGKKGKAKRPRS